MSPRAIRPASLTHGQLLQMAWDLGLVPRSAAPRRLLERDVLEAWLARNTSTRIDSEHTLLGCHEPSPPAMWASEARSTQARS